MGLLKAASRQKAPPFSEDEVFRAGYIRVAGLDEAGRGPLAGPVVAAAVVLARGCRIEGVADSKQVTPPRREALYPEIMAKALDYGLGVIGNEVIDRVNILEATRLAMGRAVENLQQVPDYLLTDAVSLPLLTLPQRPIVRGDKYCHAISAASILAKVVRDRLMVAYHQTYPQYAFIYHKGYGTSEHLKRLKVYGPCPIHRKSFKGVKELL